MSGSQGVLIIRTVVGVRDPIHCLAGCNSRHFLPREGTYVSFWYMWTSVFTRSFIPEENMEWACVRACVYSSG